MKKSVRLDTEAREEINSAIDRYEGEREGLGLEFWSEVIAVIDALGPSAGPSSGYPRRSAFAVSC